MTKLQIAVGQSVPLDVVTEALGWIGRRGSGKTYGAQRAAELMIGAGAQVVALDPVGNWWALRLSADGKSPGIQIPVFGGLRGDVPLEPTAGKLIADTIIDHGISAVVDISQFESNADKARFASDFGARLFYRKKSEPSAIHLFLEEAQEIIPQNPEREETRMLHAFQQIGKLGRNYGIGFSVLSQRPQEVHKKVLNLVEILFAFQLTGPHERKAVAGWIKDKGIDEDIDAILPKLRVGRPHVWSPVLLNISRVVEITPKWTFDASKTPKVGQVTSVRELAPIDLERLGHEIVASREKADAADPKKLAAHIRQLEGQLANAAKNLAPDPDAMRAIVARELEPRMRESATHMAASYNRALERMREGFVETIERRIGEYATLTNRVIEAVRAVELPRLTDDDINYAVGTTSVVPAPSAHVFAESGRRGGKTAAAIERRGRVESSLLTGKTEVLVDPPPGLNKGEHAILRLIAQHEPRGASVEQISVITGYKRSSRNEYLRRLQLAGYISRDDDEWYRVTAAGMRKLGSTFEPLPTGSALRNYWFARLSDGERKLLTRLTSQWPKWLSRDALDSEGYKRSSRNEYLRRLHARNLIEIGKGGDVKATDILFD